MKFLGVIVCLFALFPPSLAKDEMPVAELVKKHLDSIGTEQARATVKTRVVQGSLRFRLVNVSSGGNQDGKIVIASEGNKLVTLLKLPNPTYHGERFVSDGKKTTIANVRPGVYSEFGQFVLVHDEILREGLWTGVFSTGWPLQNLEDRHAKLQYKGLKKVDGRELHQVLYLPSKRSDLEIELYFDSEFHHVMSAYSYTISPQIGLTEVNTANQQVTRYRLEERFTDFKMMDNLTLPTRWTVVFMPDVPQGAYVEGAGGSGGFPKSGVAPLFGASHNAINEFAATELSVSNNVSLDPKNFEVK